MLVNKIELFRKIIYSAIKNFGRRFIVTNNKPLERIVILEH